MIISWDGAACRTPGVDPELFHTGLHIHDESAKAICADCPLRVKCADVAVADPSLSGIWGGLTGADRAALRTGNTPQPPSATCRRGHRYTRKTTQYKNGYRSCLTCRYQREAATRQARRATA